MGKVAHVGSRWFEVPTGRFDSNISFDELFQWLWCQIRLRELMVTILTSIKAWYIGRLKHNKESNDIIYWNFI